MARTAPNWYRLDNAGMVYSAIQRDDYSAVYRFSAVMDAPVDPERLRQAARRVMPRFPGLQVRLRRGVFWYYFDSDPSFVPDVEPDSSLRAEIQAAAQAHGVETLLVTDGAVAELGETTLRVFPPLGTGGSNEEGLSVLGSAGEFDVLVTGDMNAAVERRLVKYGNLPETELLVVGHHGSAASPTQERRRRRRGYPGKAGAPQARPVRMGAPHRRGDGPAHPRPGAGRIDPLHHIRRRGRPDHRQ